MRKRAASGKSTSCWRLSFWLFSIGFRIITALFHNKTTVFVLKTVVFLTLSGFYFVRIFTAARAADAASGV